MLMVKYTHACVLCVNKHAKVYVALKHSINPSITQTTHPDSVKSSLEHCKEVVIGVGQQTDPVMIQS